MIHPFYTENATCDEVFTSNVRLDFLDPGKEYIVTFYTDAPGGSFAISIHEVTNKEQTKGLKRL